MNTTRAVLLTASTVAPTPKRISSALVEEIQDLSTDLRAERGDHGEQNICICRGQTQLLGQHFKLSAETIKGRGRKGIQSLLIAFLENDLVHPCQSAENTPNLFLQQSSTDEYWFVQDLRAIIKRYSSSGFSPYTLTILRKPRDNMIRPDKSTRLSCF